MAPRAIISGGESADSPMRVTYEDTSDNESSIGRATALKQVLKKPSRLLRRQSLSKLTGGGNNSPSTPSRSSSSTGREIRSRSIRFAPSLERIHHHHHHHHPRPPSSEEFDCYGRESPLMETQQMSNALPELDQPQPRRMLPKANLEAIMSKPLPAPPQQQQTVNVMHGVDQEPAITALPPMPGSKMDMDDVGPQKRKSSNELAEANARSQPKTKQPEASISGKKPPSRLTKSTFAKTAVMEWMENVDPNAARPQSQQAPATGSASASPSRPTSHAAVVLSIMDEDRDNIAKAAAKLIGPEVNAHVHAPPMPVPEREASARRKRDSSMTATSFTPSIFSRASTWTDHTFLTTPSEMVAGDVRTKRTSRDSRDSWRFTRSFASPRSSVMSYSSIPFRSRPFKIEDKGDGSEDNASSGPSDAEQASGPNNAEVRSQDRTSISASEHMSIAMNRPLSLSPVVEGPEIRVSESSERDQEMPTDSMASVRDMNTDRRSIAAETMDTVDAKGTINSTVDSVDAATRQNGRFRGAFSPGMPREIFGYHTLDFSASRLPDESKAEAKGEAKKEENGKAPVRSLEHRRSVSSEILNDRNETRTIVPSKEPAPTVRQMATVNRSLTASEASLSPTESEFGEGSSGITDYTDDDIVFLSDFPGIGRPLQLALANIRRDVVNMVMQELSGVSSYAHEANGGYSNGNQTLPQGSASASNGNGQGGGNGGMKRPSTNRGGEENEDREEGDPGKRRKLNNGAIHASILRSRFACPFYKRNPDAHQRWRSCRGPGWEEVRRVKEHVYRRHMLFTCPRCLVHFEEKSALEDHAQAENACTKANTPPPQDIEGCSQDQERKLRCRKRPPGETDEDRWAEMYRILFGDDAEVPGPYYDFDLPTTSPSPSDLPIIEDTFRQLPQRLAMDISRRLRRPLDDDERDALPEIIRTSLQAVMPPFWRMFASTPGSEMRAAPPASDQGDSAYGSAEHDRESSAPPRPYHAAQMSQTNLSQAQTPNQTPSQHPGAKMNYHPPPSRDLSFTQMADNMYNNPSAWPQGTSQSYVQIPQMPGTTTYPQTYHHAPVSVAQPNFNSVTPTSDPPIHEDFGDLLVPNEFAPAGNHGHMKQEEQGGLRWSIPTSMAGNNGGELPALPLNTIPYSMPSGHTHPHTTGMSYHQQIAPTAGASTGPSPNFNQQYTLAPPPQMPQPQPQMNMNQYHHGNMHQHQHQHQVSMAPPYHQEANSGAVRAPNNRNQNQHHRQSVNMLATTDQIDEWMFSLNAAGAGGSTGGGASGVQDVFTGGVVQPMGMNMNMMNMGMGMGMGFGMGAEGKKRMKMEYSRG